MQAARGARVDMGYGLEGPLPDLLAAIEGPGGAQVVVLDLGDDVAGACLQRRPTSCSCSSTAAQAAGSPALHARARVRPPAPRPRERRRPRRRRLRRARRPVRGRGELLRRRVPRPVRGRPSAGRRGAPSASTPSSRLACRVRRERADGADPPRDVRRARRPARSSRAWIARSTTRTCTSPSPRTSASPTCATASPQAAATMPRLPPALRGSVLGGLLTGELTLAQARGPRPGAGSRSSRRALADLGLAGLVPSRGSATGLSARPRGTTRRRRPTRPRPARRARRR